MAAPTLMASFLQQDHNTALGGGRHFFSPTTPCGPGGAPSTSP